jgi:hypothetical protein
MDDLQKLMPSLPRWVKILDSFGLTMFSERIFQKKYRQDMNRLKTLPPQVQEVAEQVLRKILDEVFIHQNAIK